MWIHVDSGGGLEGGPWWGEARQCEVNWTHFRCAGKEKVAGCSLGNGTVAFVCTVDDAEKLGQGKNMSGRNPNLVIVVQIIGGLRNACCSMLVGPVVIDFNPQQTIYSSAERIAFPLLAWFCTFYERKEKLNFDGMNRENR